MSCDKMSDDIEHFEESISRVQQYIDQDDLAALSDLLTELQQSLDMIQSLSFFQ